MTQRARISLEGVSKRFRIHADPFSRLKSVLGRGGPAAEVAALRDFSLDVGTGETVGIIGLNGAGKSTLLQLICGIRSPSSGRLRVDGKVASLMELGAGFNPEFTGRENVFIYGAVLGMRRSEIEAKFEAIAAFADIGRFMDLPMRTYSSGMMMRLAFGIATQVEADVLIFDEVLAVGDAAFQFKCFQRIGELQRGGVTILLVTHDLETVSSLCTRAVIVHGGRKHFDGKPADALWEYWRLVSAPAGGQAPRASVGQADLKAKIGTGEASFLAAEVFDEDGGRRPSFSSGSQCLLRLAFTVSREVPRGSIGVHLQDRRAGLVYGFNTASDPSADHSWRTARRYEAIVRLQLNLAPGKYFPSVSCNRIEDGRIVCMAALDSFAEISIEAKPGVFGSAELFARIRTEEAAYEKHERHQK